MQWVVKDCPSLTRQFVLQQKAGLLKMDHNIDNVRRSSSDANVWPRSSSSDTSLFKTNRTFIPLCFAQQKRGCLFRRLRLRIPMSVKNTWRTPRAFPAICLYSQSPVTWSIAGHFSRHRHILPFSWDSPGLTCWCRLFFSSTWFKGYHLQKGEISNPFPQAVYKRQFCLFCLLLWFPFPNPLRHIITVFFLPLNSAINLLVIVMFPFLPPSLLAFWVTANSLLNICGRESRNVLVSQRVAKGNFDIAVPHFWTLMKQEGLWELAGHSELLKKQSREAQIRKYREQDRIMKTCARWHTILSLSSTLFSFFAV